MDAASNGIGSDAVLLIYYARQKKVWSLNAEGTAPKLATIEWYQKNQNGKIPVNDTLLSATVPGWSMPGHYALALGNQDFREVLAPAIDLAERGYPLSELTPDSWVTSNCLSILRALDCMLPEGRNGKKGTSLRIPTLPVRYAGLWKQKERVRQGREAGLRAARDRFYKGDIAREMAQFSEQNGGLFRYEDFASYTAKVEEPVSVNYRGYEVYKNPSASQGPAELFALNLLEGYDLKAMGHNSANYIHTSVEAMKLAMADRDKYLGDMDFIRIPYEGLLSKRYAEERRKLISTEKASFDFRPGEAEKFMSGFEPVDRPLDITIAGGADHEGDTSYIAVVDQERNAISFTPSLHSGFGTKVVMGNLGFILNCRGDYYSLVPGHANALATGQTPAQHAAGYAGHERWKALPGDGKPGRRRSMHANLADVC